MTEAVAGAPWLRGAQRGNREEAALPRAVAGVLQPRGGVGCRAPCGNVLQLMLCDSLTRPPGTAGADTPSSELSLFGFRTTAFIVNRRRG